MPCSTHAPARACTIWKSGHIPRAQLALVGIHVDARGGPLGACFQKATAWHALDMAHSAGLGLGFGLRDAHRGAAYRLGGRQGPIGAVNKLARVCEVHGVPPAGVPPAGDCAGQSLSARLMTSSFGALVPGKPNPASTCTRKSSSVIAKPLIRGPVRCAAVIVCRHHSAV